MVTQHWAICLGCLLILVITIHAEKRQIDIFGINPNCNQTNCKVNGTSDDESAINLVYIKSSGTNDSLHYIWTTIGGAPGFLLIQTGPEDNVTINWTELLEANPEKSITFPTKPKNSIGLVISKFYFWDDTKQDGQYSPKNPTIVVPWKDFIWQDTRPDFHCDKDNCHSIFKLKHEILNGTFSLDISCQNSDGRQTMLPQLLKTPESISVRLTADGMKQDYFKKVRTGVEFVMYTSSSESELKRSRSMDDEWTPGVFEKVTWQFSEPRDEKSYVFWKPVIYSNSVHNSAHTLDVVNSKIGNSSKTNSSESWPIYGYFSTLDDYQLFKLNITFGNLGDKYYDYSNYTYWSFSMGLGEAPADELSLLVELIILIGFGLPLLALLLSGVYFGVKKLRSVDIRRNLLDSEELQYD